MFARNSEFSPPRLIREPGTRGSCTLDWPPSRPKVVKFVRQQCTYVPEVHVWFLTASVVVSVRGSTTDVLFDRKTPYFVRKCLSSDGPSPRLDLRFWLSTYSWHRRQCSWRLQHCTSCEIRVYFPLFSFFFFRVLHIFPSNKMFKIEGIDKLNGF